MDLFRNQAIQKGEKRRSVNNMEIKCEEPKDFAIFCKKCGSYNIDVFLDIDDFIIFLCKNCDTEEEI